MDYNLNNRIRKGKEEEREKKREEKEGRKEEGSEGGREGGREGKRRKLPETIFRNVRAYPHNSSTFYQFPHYFPPCGKQELMDKMHQNRFSGFWKDGEVGGK
jgi:hypothetical protein